MNKRLSFLVILVMVLAFEMTVVGCDNGSTNGDRDIWSNVTSFSQLHGNWKAQSTVTANFQDIKVTAVCTNYTLTFNDTVKTMSVSGSVTATYSGSNTNAIWSDIKELLGEMNEMEGVTVTFNDAKHSYTITYNYFSQTLTNEDITEILNSGLKINQTETKLSTKDFMGIGVEIIYTKQ